VITVEISISGIRPQFIKEDGPTKELFTSSESKIAHGLQTSARKCSCPGEERGEGKPSISNYEEGNRDKKRAKEKEPKAEALEPRRMKKELSKE
jgi:hypothetical protein